MKRLVLGAILLVLLCRGIATARTTPMDLSALRDLPAQARGLVLHISAAKDTFVLGEPVMLEVFLHNSGSDTLHDYCMLNPHYGDIQIYAILTSSAGVRFEPEAGGDVIDDLVGPSYFTIPPGRCVGSLVTFGTNGLLPHSSMRGPYEFGTRHFPEVGCHRVLATYRRRPGGDEVETPPGGRVIVSRPDSFFVAEPEGWDRSVFEAIGEDIFGVDVQGRLDKPGGAEAIAESQKFLRAICSRDSVSVYAPWLRAAYARGFILGWPGMSGYRPAAAVLEKMIERYPKHRLSEEMEFSMAGLLCAGGLSADASSYMNRLLLKYPANVRAYQTCIEDIRQPVFRDDVTLGGTCAGR